MAGQIQNVNLLQLKGQLEEYKALVTKMQNSVLNIYKRMSLLNKFWSGKRINKVISLWNKNVNIISEQSGYFVRVELILREIVEQYQSMEQGNAVNKDLLHGLTGNPNITKIKLTDESTITYNRSKARTIIVQLKNETTLATTYLKQLVNKLDSLQGYSDSLKTLATEYSVNATQLQKSLNTICKIIIEEAEKAMNDTNITEEYNEKDAKRAATTSKK